MLSLNDCIDYVKLWGNEIDAMAKHDHRAAIISAEMENYCVGSPGDSPMLESVILDDISQALSCEDFTQAATLLAVIRHFIETHPDNPSGQSS